MTTLSAEREYELARIVDANHIYNIMSYTPDERVFITNRKIWNALDKMDALEVKDGCTRLFTTIKRYYRALSALGLDCGLSRLYARISRGDKQKQLFNQKIFDRAKRHFPIGYLEKEGCEKISDCAMGRRHHMVEAYRVIVIAAALMLPSDTVYSRNGLAEMLCRINPKLSANTLRDKLDPKCRKFDKMLFDALRNRFVMQTR